MVKSAIVDLMIRNARNNVAFQDKVQNSMLMKINKKGVHSDPVNNVLQAKAHAAIKHVNLLPTLIK
jgi:hypothetical protein